MPSPKVFLCLLLVIPMCYSSPLQQRSDEHNIVQCIDSTSEKTRIYNEPVSIPGGFLQIKTKIIVFPTSGINKDQITCLSIQDRDANGKGAFVSIQSGGLGDYSVEIILKSQLSEGINFNIEIFTDAE